MNKWTAEKPFFTEKPETVCFTSLSSSAALAFSYLFAYASGIDEMCFRLWCSLVSLSLGIQDSIVPVSLQNPRASTLGLAFGPLQTMSLGHVFFVTEGLYCGDSKGAESKIVIYAMIRNKTESYDQKYMVLKQIIPSTFIFFSSFVILLIPTCLLVLVYILYLNIQKDNISPLRYFKLLLSLKWVEFQKKKLP